MTNRLECGRSRANDSGRVGPAIAALADGGDDDAHRRISAEYCTGLYSILARPAERLSAISRPARACVGGRKFSHQTSERN
ncbi:hypothetical protein BN2475_310123 [Paraburkholderia ribeironis]|uniref:Uncharacterized protein n=1 Tax=Paraburkholderia ribeironis TaxID=1247936 RepID=A0A1N7S2Q3_9BURK|nr:hypothetical protein BN2475_310123 [Paraburkholderia ribeironis]